MAGQFTQASLELLRQRIDLVDVLSPHLALQRSGSAYKALCPFHEEKTPSFIVQKGESHYHCFGCGAHGDAIGFLMTHLKMGFREAVEQLAEKFQVPLEKEEGKGEERGPSRTRLKQALELATQVYHYLLLHSTEGHEALLYLYQRGIDLEFIKRFQIGFAPAQGNVMMNYLLAQGYDKPLQEAAGLVVLTQSGRHRDFFSDRILFPISDAVGAVIGFSARKFKEQTFGGKYINTAETTLFKKSRVLFGLSYSRARIVKGGEAIIVEGQVDCLKMIYAGFDYTVAGQGTAFGQEHVKELLQLGIKRIYLLMDADKAGREASVKIGHLFQKKGVEVLVASLPENADPDAFLTRSGPEAMKEVLAQSQEYLAFLFHHLSGGQSALSASTKNEIVMTIKERIQEWEMPVMVHESLRRLASLAHLPESVVGVAELSPQLFVRKSASIKVHAVDPYRILETDFIRWLVLAGPQYPHLIPWAQRNILIDHLCLSAAKKLYQRCLETADRQLVPDLLQLGALLDSEEEQQFLSEVMQRKVNLAKAQEGLKETMRRLLERKWMEARDAIGQELQSGTLSDEEMMVLAKQFDTLKNQAPVVQDA